MPTLGNSPLDALLALVGGGATGWAAGAQRQHANDIADGELALRQREQDGREHEAEIADVLRGLRYGDPGQPPAGNAGPTEMPAMSVGAVPDVGSRGLAGKPSHVGRLSGVAVPDQFRPALETLREGTAAASPAGDAGMGLGTLLREVQPGASSGPTPHPAAIRGGGMLGPQTQPSLPSLPHGGRIALQTTPGTYVDLDAGPTMMAAQARAYLQSLGIGQRGDQARTTAGYTSRLRAEQRDAEWGTRFQHYVALGYEPPEAMVMADDTSPNTASTILRPDYTAPPRSSTGAGSAIPPQAQRLIQAAREARANAHTAAQRAAGFSAQLPKAGALTLGDTTAFPALRDSVAKYRTLQNAFSDEAADYDRRAAATSGLVPSTTSGPPAPTTRLSGDSATGSGPRSAEDYYAAAAAAFQADRAGGLPEPEARAKYNAIVQKIARKFGQAP